MNKYSFGRTSQKRKVTIHPLGQQILDAAIADPNCPCDFGIIKGYCGEAEQNQYFAEGKSNARWGESDHNFRQGDTPCALAWDIGPYDPKLRDYVWSQDDPRHELLAAHIKKHATKRGVKLEWGGLYKIGPEKSPDKYHYSMRF